MAPPGSVAINEGAPFDVAAGETLLFAGLRAGLRLPYECASGGCGSCKARLIEGAVATRWADAPGLSERDHRRGDRILLCQSVPDGACEIRVPLPDGAPAAPTPQRFPATLLGRRQLTSDTAVFEVGLDAPITYRPGQFAHLEFADGTRRAYSMTRADGEAGTIEFLVRAKPGGSATAWLFDRLTVGDPLLVEGPYGKAYAQSTADRPVLCLAGGTGLGPILAIADSLQAQSPTRRLEIYVGARSVDDLVLDDRLAALRERGARVTVAVDAGADPIPRAFGTARSGFALEHADRDLPDLHGWDLYLAGPPPMIDAALRLLVRDGTASADRVFLDRFL